MTATSGVAADSLTDAQLSALNEKFERSSAAAAIRWAVETFGERLALTASMQDSVLIDIATRIDPRIEVVFIDTGDHFPETLETVERVRERYDLNLRVMKVPTPPVPFHEVDPVRCCSDAKVEQLDLALRDKAAWMSGLRRDEASTRADAPIVSRDRRGLVKLNPLATWTDDDVAGYVRDHDIIYNPLLDQGYLSIGCAPTTRPVEAGADARSGRWAGSDKTECGMHE